jgi:hypothetical protein
VAATIIPELKRLRKENHEFKASLDYIVRPCLKKKKKGREKEKGRGVRGGGRGEGEGRGQGGGGEEEVELLCFFSLHSPLIKHVEDSC